jgi:signal transduction histidine kinase
LVEGALTEVRLEAGAPAIESIAVAPLIEEIAVGAAMQAEAHGLGFTVGQIDGDLVVDADRQLLVSATSNLLQNAFKFTRPRGSVRLSTRATADRILIDVCDECGGFPEEKRKHLFGPFTQGNTRRPGLGLGLTIARRAIRASSGDISVRDVPGTGCVFTIDLPRHQAGA